MQPHGLEPASLLCPWDFPGKNTGVGCQWLIPLLNPDGVEGLRHHHVHPYQSWKIWSHFQKASFNKSNYHSSPSKIPQLSIAFCKCTSPVLVVGGFEILHFKNYKYFGKITLRMNIYATKMTYLIFWFTEWNTPWFLNLEIECW